MAKILAALMIVTLVASCGGRSVSSSRAVTRIAVASGPISAACLRAGRKDASRQRCGCVQAVANRSLSSSDQSLGASFFSDPQKAQDIRQSDQSRHEAFWQRWKAFGAEARQYCAA